MMKKEKQIVYSEPIEEIISTPPKSLVRWGTTLLFVLFVMFFLFAWLVKFPDDIPGPIEITTETPNITMVSKITGRIDQLYVNDGDQVSKGQILALMETPASLAEVESLKRIIDTVSDPENLKSTSFPSFSQLAEIQEYYSSFLKLLDDYNAVTANDFYGNKIASVDHELTVLASHLDELSNKEEIVRNNLQLETNEFFRDSSLYEQGFLSKSEYEKALKTLNDLRLSLQEVVLEQSSLSVDMVTKQEQRKEYLIQRRETNQTAISELNRAFQLLTTRIDMWISTYLLIAPANGTISFSKFWSSNQSVSANEVVMGIIPENPGEIIGRMTLDMQRSGKVEVGQQVIIKLSSYPYLEYGTIMGNVKSKSSVADSDNYIIEVSLPNGLTTIYDKTLEFSHNMSGTAEIITDNQSILQRIFYPIQYIINRNKYIK